jgi:hypothetical protein
MTSATRKCSSIVTGPEPDASTCAAGNGGFFGRNAGATLWVNSAGSKNRPSGWPILRMAADWQSRDTSGNSSRCGTCQLAGGLPPFRRTRAEWWRFRRKATCWLPTPFARGPTGSSTSGGWHNSLTHIRSPIQLDRWAVLKFSPDGTRLASLNRGGNIAIWAVEGWRRLSGYQGTKE